MAMSLARPASRWNVSQNSDINVTPFVDVMLVLLIIFMVALPVATVSVKVDLPTAAVPDRPVAPPVIVSLTLAGRVYVGDRATTLEALPEAVLAAAGPSSAHPQINLRADRGVNYGTLMEVMNRLRLKGYDKIGLVGEEL
jgi:biopolymer transport protein ExbD